jgi:glyoxylase-like metal-dependent hydrolase (beta-lactamase superfamily II)
MSQVRRLSRLSDLPVQFLILTNHFSNRSANTAQFAAKGVRIIAQENAARRLSKDSPAVLTYETSHPLNVGGVQMTLHHFGHARTDGDTVVDFTNLKIVAVGDLVATQPDPDFRSGGSLAGWPAVLAGILKLDFDTAIPSTGPALSRREVEAFKARIETVLARASALVKRGVPKEQLMEQLKTDDLGWHFSFNGADLDAFYAELST